MTAPPAPQRAPRVVPLELGPALDSFAGLLAQIVADAWRRADAAGRVTPPRAGGKLPPGGTVPR